GVLDRGFDVERVAGARVDARLHHDAVGLTLGGAPGHPAQEPVDGVLLGRLVEGELIVVAVESVAAVAEPVRPWHQHGAVSAVADRLERVGLEHVAPAVAVGADAAADLDDGRALLAVDDLELLAGGRRWHAVRLPSRVVRPLSFCGGPSRAAGGALVAAPRRPRRSRPGGPPRDSPAARAGCAGAPARRRSGRPAVLRCPGAR